MTAEEYKVEDVQVTPEVKADPAQDIQAAQPAEVVQSAQAAETTPSSQPQLQPMYEEGAERFAEESVVPVQHEVQPITGGELNEYQVMDMLTQIHTNDIYNEAELKKAGIESKMREAATYYEQKEYELGVKQYHLAKRNAIRESQYTGYYISPEASDMIAQEIKAQQDIESPDTSKSAKARAQSVLTKVDSYFKTTGLSRAGRITMAKIQMNAAESARRYQRTVKETEISRMREAVPKAMKQTLEAAIMKGHTLDEVMEAFGEYLSPETIDSVYSQMIGSQIHNLDNMMLTEETDTLLNNFFDGSQGRLYRSGGNQKIYKVSKEYNGHVYTAYAHEDENGERTWMTNADGLIITDPMFMSEFGTELADRWQEIYDKARGWSNPYETKDYVRGRESGGYEGSNDRTNIK